MSSPETPRRGLDPRVKVAGVLAVSVTSVVVDSLAALGVLAVLSLAAFLTAPLTGRTRRAAFLGAAAILWSTAVGQSIFYAAWPRTPWIVLVGPGEAFGIVHPGLAVFREGAAHGAVQGLRFVAVTLAGLALALTTPADRLLGALRGLGVPHGLAFLCATALRFVPVVAGEAATVRAARRARGRPLWRLGPIGWLGEEVAMLRPVIGGSVRRARGLAEVLDMRGFDPVEPRASREPRRLDPREKALALGALGAAAAVVAVKGIYWLYLLELVYSPRLRPLYAFARGWL